MKESLIASNMEMLDLIEDLLKEGKVVRLRIKGGSMMPLLRNESSSVDLTAVNQKDIKTRAVVLCKYNNGFLLHRIIRKEKNRIILRGDNLYQPKEYISPDQVVGIVKRIIYPSGKEISANSFVWKFYSTAWLLIKPFLRLVLVGKTILQKK